MLIYMYTHLVHDRGLLAREVCCGLPFCEKEAARPLIVSGRHQVLHEYDEKVQGFSTCIRRQDL
jgi:hypothetical protein